MTSGNDTPPCGNSNPHAAHAFVNPHLLSEAILCPGVSAPESDDEVADFMHKQQKRQHGVPAPAPDVRELADELDRIADCIEAGKLPFWKSRSDAIRLAAAALRSQSAQREEYKKKLCVRCNKPWGQDYFADCQNCGYTRARVDAEIAEINQQYKNRDTNRVEGNKTPNFSNDFLNDIESDYWSLTESWLVDDLLEARDERDKYKKNNEELYNVLRTRDTLLCEFCSKPSEPRAMCIACEDELTRCNAKLPNRDALTNLDISAIALGVFDADGPDSMATVRDVIARYEKRLAKRGTK